jgi:hypothetical protein
MTLRQLTLAAPLALGLGCQHSGAASGSMAGEPALKLAGVQDEALHGNTAGGAATAPPGAPVITTVRIGRTGAGVASPALPVLLETPMKFGNGTASSTGGQTGPNSTIQVPPGVQVGVAGGSSVSAGGSSYGSTPVKSRFAVGSAAPLAGATRTEQGQSSLAPNVVERRDN